MKSFDGLIIGARKALSYLERQHVMRYLFALDFVSANDLVLDCACGSGYGSWILSQKAAGVYGVDISQEALSYAQYYYNRDNITFLPGDALKLPFPNHFFNVVVTFETIEHVIDGNEFLVEMKRVLKPDGVLVLSTPNRKWSFHPPYHLREYSPSELFVLLKSHFSDVAILYQYEHIADRLRELVTNSKLTRVALRAARKLRIISRVEASEASPQTGFLPDLGLNYKYEAVTADRRRLNGIQRILIAVCRKPIG